MDPNTKNEMNQKKFGNFPQPQNKWDTKQTTNEVSKSISDLVSSIRILEDRYLNLRKKSQITDQNLIETQKDFYKEKKHLNQELIDAKMKLHELIDDIKIMKGELKDTAKQKDVKAINTYLDIWEPTKFATRKEVENLIKEKK